MRMHTENYLTINFSRLFAPTVMKQPFRREAAAIGIHLNRKFCNLEVSSPMASYEESILIQMITDRNIQFKKDDLPH